MTTARDEETQTAVLPNAEAAPAVGIRVDRPVRPLVERLRACEQGLNLGADGMGWSPAPALLKEAADEIERLRAEVAALQRDTIDALANEAAKALPSAGMVCLCVEQNAGWVSATDWDGNEWGEPADMTMADKMRAAVQWVNAADAKVRAA